MSVTDAQNFFSHRLHHRRTWGSGRVTRRFATRVDVGRSERIEKVDRSIELRCAQGCLWVTHDGDPKDIMLQPGQSYRAQKGAALTVHAVVPGVLEIEFSDRPESPLAAAYRSVRELPARLALAVVGAVPALARYVEPLSSPLKAATWSRPAR